MLSQLPCYLEFLSWLIDGPQTFVGRIPFPQESGYFKETIRSSSNKVPTQERDGGKRNIYTTIYYMITPELGRKNYLQRINSECIHYFHDHGSFPDLFEASSNYYKARDGINEGHWRGERLYTWLDLWLCDLFLLHKGNKYGSHNPSLQDDNPHLLLHWRGFLNWLDQTCTEEKCPYRLPLLCFQHSMLALVALTRSWPFNYANFFKVAFRRLVVRSECQKQPSKYRAIPSKKCSLLKVVLVSVLRNWAFKKQFRIWICGCR